MRCRRVHHKKEPYDIMIDRSGKWGSPFTYKKYTKAKYIVSSRKESIDSHREWLLNGDGQYLLKDLHELRGKILGCWCSKNQSCHGDILVELVNNLDNKGLEQFF